MNELLISLTGKITETNFAVWKKDLLAQIKGVQKNLKSDTDFALATDQSKGLKAAETALKKAKESAIEQASEIQKLFAAIDEVSAAAREARLSLERQIKIRKEEIREEIIQAGMEKAKKLVAAQDDDFQLVDTREFTERGIFEDTVKGKRGTDGMDSAVGLLLDNLKTEIAEKAVAVEVRAKKLDRLPATHRPLFQDRGYLLSSTDEELEGIIADRIKVFDKEQAAAAREEPTPEPEEEPAKAEEAAVKGLDPKLNAKPTASL